MKNKYGMAWLITLALFAAAPALAKFDKHMNIDEIRADATAIRQGSEALKSTNADLSAKLASIADRKDKVIARMTEHLKGMTELTALLRQASAELKGTNADLSKQLEDWAVKKEKMAKEKGGHPGND